MLPRSQLLYKILIIPIMYICVCEYNKYTHYHYYYYYTDAAEGTSE